jgi:hypothetical protein
MVVMGFELGLILARQVLSHLNHATSPLILTKLQRVKTNRAILLEVPRVF